MIYTNININNNTDQFTYVLQYDENLNDFSQQSYTDIMFQNEIYINNDIRSNVWRKNNTHYELIECKYSENMIHSKMSKVTLYLPQFSVDTYESNISYILTLSTYIHGNKINLSTICFNRLDAEACDIIFNFGDQKYYECIKLNIPDPFYMMYSNDWQDFRIDVCGESDDQYNNTGSTLYITLYPVRIDNGNVEILNNYIGGQNSINITSNKNDYINLHINHNLETPLYNNEEPSILTELKFNEFYEGDLKGYLKETYNIENFSIKCGLVIGNEEDLYLNIEKIGKWDSYNFKFTKSDIKKNNFYNWNGWKEGINIIGSLDILNEENESVLYLLSNSIPLTQELFKFFVGDDFLNGKTIINNINLNLVNMNVYDINAYNKIENNVIKINPQEGSNKNIIQPIFYRTQNSKEIEIYPGVTQNIELQIPGVKAATIQIEGIKFNNIGINGDNMIFKIIGKLLPQNISNGTYFILGQDDTMIYSGKYKYIK